jgi:putative membrane protein insertion efficiency factor
VNAAQHLLVLLVLAYQRVVSPVLVACFGHACRFEPTCSSYAIEALKEHGAWRGSWLAARRLARCHPWGGCGCDPVPPAVR